MKRLAKILLFVMCLTAAFFVSVAIANAQVTPVNNSASVKNILSEIARPKGVKNPFTLITPDVLVKLASDKMSMTSTDGKTAVIAAAYFFADDAEQYTRQSSAAEASNGSRVGATDMLEIEIRDANRIVESIDPIVRRVYRADPTKLAAWTFASHVERHTPVPRDAKQKKPQS